jgi:hypothetical protein
MTTKNIYYKAWLLLTILFFVLSGFINIAPDFTKDFKNISYQIRPSSTLEVNGKTNINSFSCASKEQFSKKKLSYKIEEGLPIIHFQNTALKINTLQLDCGRKLITKDLHKLLKIKEYPEITISLIEAINADCNDLTACDRWVDFEIRTDITITCETQAVIIPAQVKKIDVDSYRVVGNTSLQLCAFKLEPPTAMMGLVKVDDVIEINFDLYLDLEMDAGMQ